MRLAYPEGKPSSGSSGRYEDGDGCYLQRPRRPRKMVHRIRSSGPAASLAAKKRVIRMLMVIVLLFFLCWMPIFSANAWRAFDAASAERRLSGTPISFILLLSHSSACANPIIYCFMNKRFRLGFLATFPCCPDPGPPGARGDAGDEAESGSTRASLSKGSYAGASAPPP